MFDRLSMAGLEPLTPYEFLSTVLGFYEGSRNEEIELAAALYGFTIKSDIGITPDYPFNFPVTNHHEMKILAPETAFSGTIHGALDYNRFGTVILGKKVS